MLAPSGQRVLHVLNYGWPFINGYTVRSMALIRAQRRHLGLDAQVVVSPFGSVPEAIDLDCSDEHWGPGVQSSVLDPEGTSLRPRSGWERPGIGLAPITTRLFRRGLDRVIKRFRPHLIHAHHPHYIGAAVLPLARKYRLPMIYELRCFNGDYDLDRPAASWTRPYFRMRGHVQNRLERRVCGQADAVVTLSNGLAARVREAGVAENRVFIVRNSVDTTRFDGPAGPTPGAILRVGYATTFTETEGLDTLVRSVPAARTALRERGRDLRVELAGSGEDWPRIRNLVDALSLAECVYLHGQLPYRDMAAFYTCLDVFVVPRRLSYLAQHTTPLKPLEALAMGRPLLVSDVPALRELLGHHPGVRFFEPRPQALAAALEAFADQPWSPQGGTVADRSWASEVERYRELYARWAPGLFGRQA